MFLLNFLINSVCSFFVYGTFLVAWLTPDINFLVFEAWFTIARSRLLGTTNVYHMSLYVAHSQSYQLYQMTYVERQKFDEEEDDGCDA